MILTGQYDSPFVRRVAISLRVLGFANYKHDQRSVFGDFDEMLTVNPLARIPSLTLDSGEQIFAAYGGTLSGTTGAIQGSYFIFGGTGRFRNASGLGRISGVENVNFTTGMGVGKIDLNGTVSY